MPLAEEKIDRSYIGRMAQAPLTARILADLDGVIGQGWLYARPMTAQQLVAWLKTG